jgi:hypothetical protein
MMPNTSIFYHKLRRNSTTCGTNSLFHITEGTIENLRKLGKTNKKLQINEILTKTNFI